MWMAVMVFLYEAMMHVNTGSRASTALEGEQNTHP